jgi:hypothetical protein
MNAVFADTFYWIAVTNIQDLAHEKAQAFTRSGPPGTIFTTEEVSTELSELFCRVGAAISAQGVNKCSEHARKPYGSDCPAESGVLTGRQGSLAS